MTKVPILRKKDSPYLTIDLVPHPYFRFENSNFVCEVPMAPKDISNAEKDRWKKLQKASDFSPREHLKEIIL